MVNPGSPAGPPQRPAPAQVPSDTWSDFPGYLVYLTEIVARLAVDRTQVSGEICPVEVAALSAAGG
jgi:hypothetical protein